VAENEAAKPATLGEYIRQQRERTGLSQRQLAARVGMHHSRLARLESGESSGRPAPEYLQGMADVFGIDVSKLLKFQGVVPKPELPSIRSYFRRKLGVDASEADILANLIADYQQNNQSHLKKGGTNNEQHR